MRDSSSAELIHFLKVLLKALSYPAPFSNPFQVFLSSWITYQDPSVVLLLRIFPEPFGKGFSLYRVTAFVVPVFRTSASFQVFLHFDDWFCLCGSLSLLPSGDLSTLAYPFFVLVRSFCFCFTVLYFRVFFGCFLVLCVSLLLSIIYHTYQVLSTPHFAQS